MWPHTVEYIYILNDGSSYIHVATYNGVYIHTDLHTAWPRIVEYMVQCCFNMTTMTPFSYVYTLYMYIV